MSNITNCISTEEMSQRMKMREASLRRMAKRKKTGKLQYVRYRVFVNGSYDKTITIKDYSYGEFCKHFYVKYPEYKGCLSGSEFNHITYVIKLNMPCNPK